MKSPYYPPCFGTRARFENWLEKTKGSDLKDPENSFCHDCTPKFKALMMANGLCSRPETIFVYLLPSDKDTTDIALSGISPEAYEQFEQMGRIWHPEVPDGVGPISD